MKITQGKKRYLESYLKSASLTEKEAQEALVFLAQKFKIPLPELRWYKRARRGWAYVLSNMLITGPNCWRGVTDSLLHEFSHILNFKRQGKRRAPPPHDYRFFETLIDVTTAWYGNPIKYNWITEYRTIYRLSRKRGLIPISKFFELNQILSMYHKNAVNNIETKK